MSSLNREPIMSTMRRFFLPLAIGTLMLPAVVWGQAAPAPAHDFLALIAAVVEVVEERSPASTRERELFLDLASLNAAAVALDAGPLNPLDLREVLGRSFRTDLEAARRVCENGHCRLPGNPIVIGIESVSGSLSSKVTVFARSEYNSWTPNAPYYTFVSRELFFEPGEEGWVLTGIGRLVIT